MEWGDIFIYSLNLAHEFGLNPTDIILDKIQMNDKKYPAEKVKGKSDKYTACSRWHYPILCQRLHV